MDQTEPSAEIVEIDVLRSVLKSQYHASLAMLRETLDRCPDDLWSAKDHTNAFWQLAYHTLYFAHLYLQPNEAAFKPWEHQHPAQHEDGLPGPPDPESSLPLIPSPYSRAEVLAYWNICDALVDDAVDALNINDPNSGFSWYKLSKLEHQFINIRHIQHHTAQLADRLRAAADVGVKWVGPHSTSVASG